MRIDLHTHSRVSDGTDTPTELVVAAKRAGLSVVGLTDHDTTEGWNEAQTVAADLGVGLLPGMEISTEYHAHGVHLLSFMHDPTYVPLLSELDQILEGRGGRLRRMVAALNSAGVPLVIDDVLAQATDAVSIGRPHVADALVQGGFVADRAEAFQRYLAWGKPAYVGRYAPQLSTMIGLITQAGGVAVLAHPWGRMRAEERLTEADFANLADQGLTGLEVDHQDHTPAMRDALRAMANNLGLVITGSSDYHGTGKRDHDLGVNLTAPEQFARLVETAEAVSAASGRRTPAVVLP